MHQVYILYSKQLDKFYIGECEDLFERINQHNTSFYEKSYTSKVNDWSLFFQINCVDRIQPRKIEAHIKKMKSRKYLENLVKYPEISEKLLSKY